GGQTCGVDVLGTRYVRARTSGRGARATTHGAFAQSGTVAVASSRSEGSGRGFIQAAGRMIPQIARGGKVRGQGLPEGVSVCAPSARTVDYPWERVAMRTRAGILLPD